MAFFLLFIVILHGILFRVDEYMFHRKRGLQKRELTNSLIDGLIFLITLAVAMFSKHSYWSDKIYIALSIVSCLSIVKNEFFYENLKKGERFVHALLYVFHTTILYAFYISWRINYFDSHYYIWLTQLLYMILGFQTLAYSLIYWNYIYDPRKYESHDYEDSLKTTKD